MLNSKVGMASDLIPRDTIASRQLTVDPATSFHKVTLRNLLLVIYCWVGLLYAGKIFVYVVRVLLSHHVKCPSG